MDRAADLNIGADVVGPNDERLGTVDYVVVQPPRMHITDVVVSTGALLGRDILVPIDRVRAGGDGRVHLEVDADGLAALPDYVEVQYRNPPEGWSMPSMAYPTSGILWPVTGYMPEPTDVKVNAPPGTVGLRDGMEVRSSDGHGVGTVKGLVTDGESGDVTDFEVERGLLFHHDARIPLSDVAGVAEDVVTLRLTADEARDRFAAG